MAVPQSLHIRIDQDTELRTIEERDARELFLLVERDREYLREWLPWVDYTRSVEDELAFIRNTRAQFRDNGNYGCVILYRKQIVGTIGYHPVNWHDRRAEIGYWLGAAFQGRGLMTRACWALTNHAFTVMGMNKVEIRCATGNYRSCAIPRRLGFMHEGIIRQGEWLNDRFVDLNLFGMLASEWRS